jgi:hypothetical protein
VQAIFRNAVSTSVRVATTPTERVRKARRTANVTRWRDQEMLERWVASAWLLKEKNLRKIDGHRDLWALATILAVNL